jgi:hypothetical protein
MTAAACSVMAWDESGGGQLYGWRGLGRWQWRSISA